MKRQNDYVEWQVINEGLSEVDDLRAQLMSLKHLIMHEDKFEDVRFIFFNTIHLFIH